MKRIIGKLQTRDKSNEGYILKVDTDLETEAISYFGDFKSYADKVISDCQDIANKTNTPVELAKPFVKLLEGENFSSQLIKSQRYITPAFLDTIPRSLYIVQVFKPHHFQPIDLFTSPQKS